MAGREQMIAFLEARAGHVSLRPGVTSFEDLPNEELETLVRVIEAVERKQREQRARRRQGWRVIEADREAEDNARPGVALPVLHEWTKILEDLRFEIDHGKALVPMAQPNADELDSYDGVAEEIYYFADTLGELVEFQEQYGDTAEVFYPPQMHGVRSLLNGAGMQLREATEHEHDPRMMERRIAIARALASRAAYEMDRHIFQSMPKEEQERLLAEWKAAREAHDSSNPP